MTAAKRTTRVRRALIALSLGLAVGLGAGCTSDAEKLEYLRQEAKEQREAGENEKALIRLRQALQLAPQDAAINLEIAEILDDMGNVEDALFYYGEAYRLDPTLTEAALAQVPMLYASAPDEARSLVEEVLEREPENFTAHYRLAELELLQGKHEAALEAARRAQEIAPGEAETHRIVGRVHEARAREHRARADEVDAEIFEAALQAFQKAAERSDAWYLRNDIAKLYGRWPGHDAKAKETWHEAFAAAEEAGDDTGMRSVAVSALRFARRKQDLPFLRWALERRLDVDPGRIPVWRQLVALAEAEEDGSAEEVWKRALEERPDDPLVHAAYASHLGREGRREEAIAHLESLPTDVASSPEVDLLLVKAHAVKGELEQARAAVERMEERYPEHSLTSFGEARLAIAEGRLDEAAAGLREIADGLERVDVFRLLAQVELARGNPREALTASTRAISLNEGATRRRLYQLRHRSQVELGRWRDLMSSLQQMRREGLRLQLRERLQFVRASYALDRPERGRRILERLLAQEEPSRRVLLAFARHEAARQPERVRRLLEESVQRRGPEPALVSALARLALREQAPQRALDELERLGPPEELEPSMRLLRGRALASLERWPEAETEARAVLEADAVAQASAQLLVRILRAQGKREEAIAALETQREVRQLSGRNLWLLGRMYMEEGRLDEARIVLEEAVGAAPGLHVAHNDLAFVLAETGEDLDRALDLASQARSALPSAPAVADTQGWVYYRRSMYGPAVDQFRAALEMASDETDDGLRADIHYHLGLALREQGQDAEALREMERALELEPEHAKAQEMRAKLASAPPAEAEG